MPTNREKQQELQCRRNIDLMLTKGLNEHGQILYTDLIREALLNYEVSRRMVEDWIQDFYVKPGIVLLEDDILKKREEVNQ